MLLLTILCAPLSAHQGYILDPRTWSSASRAVQLEVEPSERHGAGSARYRLSRGGVEVWSGERPFTLWEAAVSEDGIVIGFAYTDGYLSARGELQAIRFDREGAFDVWARARRHSPESPHGGCGPLAHGVALFPQLDLGVVRVGDGGGALGGRWVVRLSTGEVPPAEAVDVRKLALGSSSPPPEPRAPLPEAPRIDLEALGSFEFGRSQSPASEVRDVGSFSIDDQDRIGWIRRQPRAPEAWELVVVHPTGELHRRVELAQLAGPGWPHTCHSIWLAGDRWLVLDSNHGPKGTTRAWHVDVDAGSIHAIQGFACPEVRGVERLRDGRFVVLARLRTSSVSKHELLGFDPDGRGIWRVEETWDPANEEALHAPRAMTVTSEGAVVVLDVLRGDLRIFDSDGRSLGTTDFQKSMGSEAEWIGDVASGCSGSILLRASGDSPQIWRMSLGGEVGRLQPRWSDGRGVEAWPIRCDSHGRLWTREQDALLRLSEDGEVEVALGSPVRPELLGRVWAVRIGFDGRLYALDDRTLAVHVFDENGDHLRTFAPRPREREKGGIPHLTVASDGRVFVKSRGHRVEGSEIRYLEFAADGTESGWVSLGIDRIQEHWEFTPDGDRRWVMGFDDIFLVGRDAAIERRIDRQPDGRWLRTPRNMAVAHDGALAVLTEEVFAAGAEPSVHVFDAEGAPIASFDLRSDVRVWAPSLAWNGRWLVLAQEGGSLFLVDSRTGRRVGFYASEAGEFAIGLDPHASAGGRELWLVHKSARKVWRYAFPAD